MSFQYVLGIVTYSEYHSKFSWIDCNRAQEKVAVIIAIFSRELEWIWIKAEA